MKSEKGISLIALLLVIIIVFVAILLFTNISNKNNIVGSWNVDTINSSQISDKSYATYIFNEDSTGCASVYGINEDFTYKVKSKKIYITYIESTATFEIEYSIKDDKLYLGDDIICTKVK